MLRLEPPPPSSRDPANELYDRACDLLDASQRLTRALAVPGHEPALTATLGCVQATLRELTDAFQSLHWATPGATREVQEALAELAARLDLAERSCGSARHQRALQTLGRAELAGRSR